MSNIVRLLVNKRMYKKARYIHRRELNLPSS
jgi:hypothetical protein